MSIPTKTLADLARPRAMSKRPTAPVIERPNFVYIAQCEGGAVHIKAVVNPNAYHHQLVTVGNDILQHYAHHTVAAERIVHDLSVAFALQRRAGSDWYFASWTDVLRALCDAITLRAA